MVQRDDGLGDHQLRLGHCGRGRRLELLGRSDHPLAEVLHTHAGQDGRCRGGHRDSIGRLNLVWYGGRLRLGNRPWLSYGVGFSDSFGVSCDFGRRIRAGLCSWIRFGDEFGFGDSVRLGDGLGFGFGLGGFLRRRHGFYLSCGFGLGDAFGFGLDCVVRVGDVVRLSCGFGFGRKRIFRAGDVLWFSCGRVFRLGQDYLPGENIISAGSVQLGAGLSEPVPLRDR